MKKIISVALCLLLCLGLCANAFAASSYNVATDVRTPAESGIVKTLAIAEGVTLPAIDYTFKLAPGTATATSEFAVEDDIGVTIAAADMSHTVNMYTGSKSIADIFGTLPNKGITHAGVWIFTVTETTDVSSLNGTTTDASGNKLTKEMTTDSSVFTLRLYVTNTSTGGIEISNVTVEKDGEKVDPKIVETTETGEGASGTSTNASGFQFKNTYKETIETVPPSPTPTVTPTETGAFSVKKAIVNQDGNASSYANKDRLFEIQVELTKPATMAESDELASGVPYTIKRAATASNPNPSLITGTLSYGSNTIELSEADVMSVTKMAVGTEFKVTETGYTSAVEGYKTKSISPANGTLASTDTSGIHSVVTNEFNEEGITPTGIVVNNLPFVLIVLLAIGGIALYFITNRRRREEEE